MERLCLRLPIYADVLAIPVADINLLKADTAVYGYVIDMADWAHSVGKQWTNLKDLLCNGSDEGLAYPPPYPNDTPPPPMVPPGIIRRLLALVARIKAAHNYTETIGIDLGIASTERVVDLSAAQPTLSIQVEAGHPVLAWTKGSSDSLEIWVERTPQSGFAMLEIRTGTRYVDSAPLPALPAQWRYKAIYRMHNEHLGEWSAVATVLVGG
jgi:hypothetical protein